MRIYVECYDGNVDEYKDTPLNEVLNQTCDRYNDINNALTSDSYNFFSINQKLDIIDKHCPNVMNIMIDDEKTIYGCKYVFYKSIDGERREII